MRLWCPFRAFVVRVPTGTANKSTLGAPADGCAALGWLGVCWDEEQAIVEGENWVDNLAVL